MNLLKFLWHFILENTILHTHRCEVIVAAHSAMVYSK